MVIYSSDIACREKTGMKCAREARVLGGMKGTTIISHLRVGDRNLNDFLPETCPRIIRGRSLIFPVIGSILDSFDCAPMEPESLLECAVRFISALYFSRSIECLSWIHRLAPARSWSEHHSSSGSTLQRLRLPPYGHWSFQPHIHTSAAARDRPDKVR